MSSSAAPLSATRRGSRPPRRRCSGAGPPPERVLQEGRQGACRLLGPLVLVACGKDRPAAARCRHDQLSTGELVPTRSLIWCVGVRPDPLVERLGLPTTRGRLVVDAYLTVP